MTDVFISYSRKDKEFVSTLYAAFERSQKNIWVDWNNIPLTSDWWAEIEKGIESADTFVFVISPDSIASEVCAKEIDHAVLHNKRVFPIVRRDANNFQVGNVAHKKIQQHNWLMFREQDNFEAAFKTLTETISLDLEHLHSHTRLLVRAIEWGKGRSDSLLLRGDDLANAERWLGASAGKDPQPTELQETYIKNSRDVEDASDRAAAILREAVQKAKARIKISSFILVGALLVAGIIGTYSWILLVDAERSVQISSMVLGSQMAGRVENLILNYVELTCQNINSLNSEALRLNLISLNNIDSMQKYFQSQLKIYKDIDSIMLGTEDGLVASVYRTENGKFVSTSKAEVKSPYRTHYEFNSEGNQGKLLLREIYDHRTLPWYIATKQKKETSLLSIVTDDKQKLAISVSQPIYSKDGKLIAVFSVNLSNKVLSHFLASITITDQWRIFVMDNQGFVLASSTREPIFARVDNKIKPLEISESKDQITRETGIAIRRQFGDKFENILPIYTGEIESNDGKKRVMTLRHVHELDWIIVVTFPKPRS